MLTNNEIQTAKTKGVLVPYRPRIAAMGTKRAFLMSKSLNNRIVESQQSSNVDVIHRWASLEGDILHFVTGGYVNRNFIKQLEPPKFEHWCLRSVRPSPSIRVFGRFAQPDVFVGTHAIERTTLKGKWSLEWELEKLFCEKDIWEVECELPPRPFSAEQYTDYITENASENVRIT